MAPQALSEDVMATKQHVNKPTQQPFNNFFHCKTTPIHTKPRRAPFIVQLITGLHKGVLLPSALEAQREEDEKECSEHIIILLLVNSQYLDVQKRSEKLRSDQVFKPKVFSSRNKTDFLRVVSVSQDNSMGRSQHEDY